LRHPIEKAAILPKGIETRSSTISLTGGLGNQLFQLAFGMWASKNSDLRLEWSLCHPRLNDEKIPEVCSFVLPKNVILEDSVLTSKIASRLVNHKLRLGLYKKKYEGSYFYRVLINFFVNLTASRHLGRCVRVVSGIGNGYSDQIVTPTNPLFVGFFQSYRWVQDGEIKSKMMELCLKKNGKELEDLKQLSKIEHPLIVHIRLGDYLNDRDRGIPSSKYYEKSISYLWKSKNYGKIWLFSDQLEEAQSYIGLKWRTQMRLIPEVDGSASSTLEAMRLGKGYVIGNSTFSWWGAYLSYTGNASVVAPDPWFKKGQSPLDLIPYEWHLEDSN